MTDAMSWISDIIGSITGSTQANAAQGAAQSQTNAAQAGIDEQRRQFDSIVKLMAPYIGAGYSALGDTGNLLGLGGNDAQQTAINGLQNSAGFQSLLKQGENSILSNASATGGLRGGNVQAALSQYSPQLLNQQIQQQVGNLMGIAGLGQSSAGLQANAGMASSNNIADLLGQQGAAQAGAQIGQANASSSGLDNILKIGSTIASFF
jgi:hypothetical protein